MASTRLGSLADLTARTLLARIAPGSALLGVGPLPGSFSNDTQVVRARTPAGEQVSLVVRRYVIFGDYDRGEKARREFRAIQLALSHDSPSPEPLLLDDTGAILGSPGIVTRLVPGALRLEPGADPLPWVRAMAVTLARLHAVPCGAAVPEKPCGQGLPVRLIPARVLPASRKRSSIDNAPLAGSKLMTNL